MYVWEVPRYSPTEAGRIVGLSVGRVRRWLQGYEYQLGTEIVRKNPVVARGTDSKCASFLDLIDLLFVKKFIEAGFSLQKIRGALTEAYAIIGGHHFAQRSFMTDGKRIYLWVKEHQSQNLVELFSGGQWVIEEFITEMADQIDFDQDTGFAERWYPEGKNGRIVLDPRIAFGAPTIVGTGIRTANVLDFFVAEEEDCDKTASWLDLRADDVTAAVVFEKSIAA